MTQRAAENASSSRRLGIAALVTGGFMVAEFVGGYLAGSLALIADAGHMLTDTAALAMAFVAARLARRPPDSLRSYGYERVQVIAALVNSLGLLLLVAWLVVEAVQRLLDPQPVDAVTMLWIALLGAAVNVGVAVLLHRDRSEDINVGAAYLHVLSDLGGSVAAALAAGVILAVGWTRADPMLSLFICVLIARGAWSMLRRSSHILLEGTPEGLDPARLASELREAVPTLEDVHHVHAWSLGSRKALVTLHARVCAEGDTDQALAAIKHELRARYGVTHSTIQLERGRCLDAPAAGRGQNPSAARAC